MKLLDKINKKKYKRAWHKYYKKDKRDVKVPNMSIYEYFSIGANNNLDDIAINYFNKKITYKSFLNDIDLCARSLKASGIREGDVVTICMANTPEALISFYAINKIGAIANMVHPLSAEEEIKHALNSTESVMLIAINMSYSKIKNIIDDTKVYKTVIVSAGDSMPKLMSVGYYVTQGRKVEVPKKSEIYMYWNEFLARGKKYDGNVLIKTTKDQAAVILHSGGTTGTPKNIILTNGNINVVVEQARIILPELNREDSFLAVLPIFHCFGLVVCIHVPLCIGSSVVLLPQFDAKRFDKILTKYKPTVVAGVPTLFEALLTNKHMEGVDLSFIKYAVSGGDTLNVSKNEEVNEFLRKHNCDKHIIQGYGMTETSGPVTFGALGSDLLGSVGIPLPGNDVKIINVDTKEECEIGEVGEILISGPTVMAGYLNNEKETNEILKKDKKGKIWVSTGDLGYISTDGVLFFVQRLKRMLIVSGYNVYPSHIEEVINSHSAVLSCVVVGVPHPYKVQIPKAFIVLKDGISPSGEIKKEIKELCQKNLAAYMMPKEFEYRESLPKTKLGKVNYRELS